MHCDHSQSNCCMHTCSCSGLLPCRGLLSLLDTQDNVTCTLRAGTSIVRLHERPPPRPLAAVRSGGALTVEANLFSRFARVLRATFFFYGDAAGVV